MNKDVSKDYKAERILKLLFRALKGESLSVSALANESNISTRSITRDINDLKAFLADNREVLGNAELKYSSNNHCYTLEMDNLFTNKELFALSKVLIGSRAFNHEELLSIIWKLKTHTSFSDKKKLENQISKELFHYTEVYSDCDSIIDNIWKLSTYIEENRAITIYYCKANCNKVRHKIIPISINFTEYYFYLIAYKYNGHNLGVNSTPELFRIDRITDITVHREQITHSKNQDIDKLFLYKLNQFVYPSPIKKIRFEFSGPSLQTVFERFPTARLIEQLSGKSIIETEGHVDGIKMFLLSQGAFVKVLGPQDFIEEMKSEILKMQSLY